MSMLDKLRDELRELLDKRAEAKTKIDDILATAEARDDSNLTEEEDAAFQAARGEARKLDGEIATRKDRIADIEEMNERDAERDELAKTLQPEVTPKSERGIKVTKEEPTYRRGGKHSFFLDALTVRQGYGGDAAQRLERYNAELRDVGTGAFGDGLVIPSYLPEMYAENLRAGRVTANICRSLPLPARGMTVTIPRGTTGTAVAAQSDQNSAVQETDFDETDLVVNVRTYAGQQDMSRQAVERGEDVDVIIYSDLAAAYATKLDTDILNGAGTNGTHTGILVQSGIATVTASGTAGQTQRFLLAKIAEAIGTVNGARFMPADAIVMAPRRWAWFCAGADANGRPLVLPSGNVPQNAMGVGENAAYGLVGDLYGVPVWTDGNIPTTLSSSTFSGSTEDAIIVARRQDLLLWEEGTAPRRFTFEETLGGSLTIKAVVAGYSAFTAGWYPAGTVKITGSSLTTPTFS